jgi:hypothetical protein
VRARLTGDELDQLHGLLARLLNDPDLPDSIHDTITRLIRVVELQRPTTI